MKEYNTRITHKKNHICKAILTHGAQIYSPSHGSSTLCIFIFNLFYLIFVSIQWVIINIFSLFVYYYIHTRLCIALCFIYNTYFFSTIFEKWQHCVRAKYIIDLFFLAATTLWLQQEMCLHSIQNRGWAIKVTIVALIAQPRFWLCTVLKRTQSKRNS